MAEKQVPTGAGTVDSPLNLAAEGLVVSSNWVSPNPLAGNRVANGTNPAKHVQIRPDAVACSY